MLCPKCGKELNSDMLFCEHCGEEIRIVSDFDPEVDGIVTDFNILLEEEALEEPTEDRAEYKREELPVKKKDIRKGTVWCSAGIGVLLLMALGIFCYQYFSDTYQYRMAQKYILQKEYGNAVYYAERAARLEPDNPEYLCALLSCRMAENEAEQAKELCLKIIELDSSSQYAYQALISLYEKEAAYGEINELLKTCMDEQIISRYSFYLVKAPEFSVQPGVYDETFSLKMIANTKGTIYYTMDGSDPGENSEVYTAPILLETGSYTVRSVFVNDYGVKSEETSGVYYIDQTVPEPPVILTEAGEYSVPTLIYAEAGDNCTVYFTTDGTVPTQDSTQYVGPISMPVGVSHFRFVNCSMAGVLSEETEKFYTLNLHANLSIEAARNKLLIELMEADVILDMNGSIKTGSGHHVYNYRYVVTIGNRDFYLYREYYEDDAGNSAATGTEYVVDIMEGQCYKAVQSQTGDEETDPWARLKLQNILSGSNPE